LQTTAAQSVFGTAKTAASPISGTWRSTSSIISGALFEPPRLIISSRQQYSRVESAMRVPTFCLQLPKYHRKVPKQAG
jgi:hypothetical protein